jgi:hypothetical protein
MNKPKTQQGAIVSIQVVLEDGSLIEIESADLTLTNGRFLYVSDDGDVEIPLNDFTICLE